MLSQQEIDDLYEKERSSVLGRALKALEKIDSDWIKDRFPEIVKHQNVIILVKSEDKKGIKEAYTVLCNRGYNLKCDFDPNMGTLYLLFPGAPKL